jgi:HPt (histidine-containing phosphotransfer) domain-containing protein
VSGNRQLYLDLLKRFCEGHRDAPEQIRNALATGDINRAELLAHTLKGSAGNLGIVTVQGPAGELESGIREGSPPASLEVARVKLASEVKQVISAIRAALPPDQGAERLPVSGGEPSDGLAVIGRLRKLMEEHDSEALNLAESSSAILASALSPSGLEMLRARLKVFDFDGALAALDSR